MKGATIRWFDGVAHVVGFVNEATPLESVATAAGDTVRVNLGEFAGASSLGLKKLMLLPADVAPRPLELLECSRAFIELANVMPTVLGSREHAARVRSFVVPFHCRPCDQAVDIILEASEVKVVSGRAKAPRKLCDNCRAPLTIDAVDADDYFLFMTSV